MKYLILFLMLISSTANAEMFHFTWTLDGGKLEYKTEAKTYNEAFSRASQFCFDFFEKKKPLTEDRGLDIIDACANPK